MRSQWKYMLDNTEFSQKQKKKNGNKESPSAKEKKYWVKSQRLIDRELNIKNYERCYSLLLIKYRKPAKNIMMLNEEAPENCQKEVIMT